jgi:histidinol-phosphatase (PHP family)
LINLHVHTWRCRHAIGTAMEMAEEAARARLRVLGFAEHAPLPEEIDGWHLPLIEFPAYVAEVEEARSRHPELEILLGLEMDFIPEYEEFITEFASQTSLDYVIGSVHYIDGWNFDYEGALAEWEKRDRAEVYHRYFHLIREMVERIPFEIVGHLDLPKKFGHRLPPELWDEVEATLEAIRNKGLVLELNTAGLRREIAEAYPEGRILRRAAELRIPVTLGTDAHEPEHVAAGLDQALAYLGTLGYEEIIYFRRRRQLALPLAELRKSP